MPDAVRDAVVYCAVSEGGLSEDEAELFVRELERTRRYQTETWS